jgi:hypothetical protein
MFSRINISILLRLHCFSGDGTLTAFNIRRKKLELQSELFDAEFLSLAQMKVFIALIRPDFRCPNIKIQFKCVPVKRDHSSHNATVFLIAEGMALYIG